MQDVNKSQHHSQQPQYTWLIGLAVILAIVVCVYWTDIYEVAHVARMKNAHGL